MLTPVGPLLHHRSGGLRRDVDDALRDGATTVVVDLAGVPVVDIVCFGALVLAKQAVEAAGARFELRNADAEVRAGADRNHVEQLLFGTGGDDASSGGLDGTARVAR